MSSWIAPLKRITGWLRKSRSSLYSVNPDARMQVPPETDVGRAAELPVKPVEITDTQALDAVDVEDPRAMREIERVFGGGGKVEPVDACEWQDDTLGDPDIGGLLERG